MKSEKIQRVFKIIMLIALTAVITFMVTTIVLYGKQNVKYIITAGGSSKIAGKLEMYEQFIKDEYFGEIKDEDKLIEGAISGYVKALDDSYSEYITKDQLKQYMEQTNGKYTGIGAYITANTIKNKVQILATIKGTPAEEVGLKTGDFILKVDGKEYDASQLTEVANAMKGNDGTTVKIEILRGEENKEFTITRREIKINPIESKILDSNIGYIKITSFDDETSSEFLENYNKLKDNNIKSLIIDLRNNGGGIVDQALKIADYMVNKDETLLITIGKKNAEVLKKSNEDKIIDMQVVFLTNGNTASASEILIAAVKENVDNCKTVGEKTYGKGVIQTIFTLSDGGALKLTTNEYLTPKRNKINKIGITPDYEVSLPDNKVIAESEEKDTQLSKAVEILK